MDSSSKFPDFLGIGAARSGTTWLYKNLESHPDVWMPRIKELHYFTRSSKYHGPSFLEEYSWSKRLFSRDRKFVKYRAKVINSIGSNIIKPSWRKCCWDCRYLLLRPSDDWYVSLFKSGYQKVTGEITPRYCEMGVEDVQALKAFMPEVKIIFMMRNPVDRIWSLIRYHEERYGQALTSLGMEELIALANHPGKQEQSDYATILSKWESVFPSEQLFIGFYDEIIERPRDLLSRLSEFLELKLSRFPAQELRAETVFNSSKSKPMPNELRKYLRKFYDPMMLGLASRYGGYFQKWCDRS